MARIDYVTRETAPAKVAEVLDRLEAGGWPALNIFRAVLRSPTIGPEFLRMGQAILADSELPASLRELAILGVARSTGSNYEWVQHARLALRCGITREQVDAIAADRIVPELFDATARAVLRYTAEVTREVKASQAAFDELRRHLSEQDTVELTLVVGYYNMVSRVLESLEIELEG
jgi:4-carboxymuconolactone decarboxylase